MKFSKISPFFILTFLNILNLNNAKEKIANEIRKIKLNTKMFIRLNRAIKIKNAIIAKTIKGLNDSLYTPKPAIPFAI